MALPDDLVHRAPAELLQFAAHDRQASARDSVRCTWRLTSQPEPTNHNKISQSSGLPQQGKTLVHVACSVGDLALVRQLHEAGANLNAIDKNGHQPIHTASLRGHTELLSFLLMHGADPHARDQVYLHQHVGRSRIHSLMIVRGRAASQHCTLPAVKATPMQLRSCWRPAPMPRLARAMASRRCTSLPGRATKPACDS